MGKFWNPTPVDSAIGCREEPLKPAEIQPSVLLQCGVTLRISKDVGPVMQRHTLRQKQLHQHFH